MHRLVGVIDVLLHRLRIDARQWIMHPAVVPLQPVGHCDPQVLEWLKVFDEL